MTIDGLRPPWRVRVASVLFGVSAGAGVLMVMATIAAWAHLGPAAVVYRAARAAAGDSDLDGEVPEVRGALAYNTAVLVVVVLAFGTLAVLLRRPWRWARIAAWWAAAILGAAVMVALAGDAGSSGTGPGVDEVDRLAHELVPGWYAGVASLLGLVLLAAVGAGGFFLARSSVGEFYRPVAGRPSDERWAAVLRAHTQGDGTNR